MDIIREVEKAAGIRSAEFEFLKPLQSGAKLSREPSDRAAVRIRLQRAEDEEECLYLIPHGARCATSPDDLTARSRTFGLRWGTLFLLYAPAGCDTLELLEGFFGLVRRRLPQRFIISRIRRFEFQDRQARLIWSIIRIGKDATRPRIQSLRGPLLDIECVFHKSR